MKMYRILQTVIFAAITVGIVGCNRGPYEKLLPASGLVTLDGDPLAGATVAYIPIKSNQQQPSYGYTDAKGKYALKTPEGQPGVSPGEVRLQAYRISEVKVLVRFWVEACIQP